MAVLIWSEVVFEALEAEQWPCGAVVRFGDDRVAHVAFVVDLHLDVHVDEISVRAACSFGFILSGMADQGYVQVDDVLDLAQIGESWPLSLAFSLSPPPA